MATLKYYAIDCILSMPYNLIHRKKKLKSAQTNQDCKNYIYIEDFLVYS